MNMEQSFNKILTKRKKIDERNIRIERTIDTLHFETEELQTVNGKIIAQRK